MPLHTGVVTDSQGNVVASPTMTVLKEDGVTPATIFSDREMQVALANPFPGATTGIFQFAARPGEYQVKAEKAGITTWNEKVDLGAGFDYGAVYDPRTYGATAGEADSTIYFQRAIAAAEAAGGGTVLGPAGNWNVTSLTVAVGNVRILGEPGFSLTNVATSSGNHTVSATAGPLRVERVEFISSGVTTGRRSVALAGANDVVVESCNFHDLQGHGVSITDCQRVRVEDCDFENALNSGVLLGDPGAGTNDDIRVIDCRFNNVNTSNTEGTSPIQTVGLTALGKYNRIFVLRNRLMNCVRHGINMPTLKDSFIVGNYAHGGSGSRDGIAVDGSNVTVHGNYATAWEQHPYLVFCTTVAMSDIRFHDNAAITNTLQGLAVVFDDDTASLDGLVVTGNHFTGNSRGFALLRSPGVTLGTWANVYIADNDLRGNSSGAFNIASGDLGPDIIIQHNAVDPYGIRQSAAWNISTQAIVTGTPTALVLDAPSHEHGEWWDVANTTRITFAAPSVVQVSANVEFQAGGVGVRQLRFLLNGTTEVGRVSDQNVGAAIATRPSLSVVAILVAAGDYLEVIANHTQGTNLDVTGKVAASLVYLMEEEM